jgi:hypothetical protein
MFILKKHIDILLVFLLASLFNAGQIEELIWLFIVMEVGR